MTDAEKIKKIASLIINDIDEDWEVRENTAKEMYNMFDNRAKFLKFLQDNASAFSIFGIRYHNFKVWYNGSIVEYFNHITRQTRSL